MVEPGGFGAILRGAALISNQKPHLVAQTFQSAGSRNFPVPRAKRGDWKVPTTRRLESLRYRARRANPALEEAAPFGAGVLGHGSRKVSKLQGRPRAGPAVHSDIHRAR